MNLFRIIAAISWFCFSLFGQSQMSTGIIQGVVRDSTRGVLPGAEVTVKHLETGISRSCYTSAEGLFTAALLPVGIYELSVERKSFAQVRISGVWVTIGQTRSIEVVMKPSSISEVIEVLDKAPATNPSQIEISTVVDQSQIGSLPINGRRFLDLALLAPGIYQEHERGQLSLSGARGINSSINVDGADFNQPFFGGQRGGERSNFAYILSQEAIQEFRIVQSNFSAEFGRSAGGVINVVTKSGSSTMHGSAFYYLRHREASPRNIFGFDTAPTRQQFGASLGGPLVKDRTYFFTVFDGQREHQPLTVRFNLTNGPPEIMKRQGTFETTNHVSTYLAKIDHRLSSHNELSIRYSFSANRAANATNFGITDSSLENNGTEQDLTHTGVISLNSSLSSGILNEFRAHYSYESRPRTNNMESNDFKSIAGPEIRIVGCCALGGMATLPANQHDGRWQFADNLSFINGRHQVKLGVDVSHTSVSQVFRGNWRGLYLFTSLDNYIRAAEKQINPATGQPYPADFMRIYFGNGKFQAGFWDFAGYLQDTIRLNSNLSLYAGLRYEAALMPQPPKPNPLLPYTSEVPNDLNMWQPRLGLSWSPGSESRTVIRLGAGLFNARTPSLLVNQVFNSNGNPDVGVTFNLIAPQINAVQKVHPEFVFPFVPETSNPQDASYFTSLGLNVRPDASFFAPDFRNPRSFQYGISIERQLPESFVGNITFIHSHTVHLERIRDVNLPQPTIKLDHSTPPVLRPRFNLSARPNPAFGILRQQESSTRSNYDAFIIGLDRRFARLQFRTSYTLSYNKDDDSNERNYLGINYENVYNLGSEYRWSRNDIRHRWILNSVWELPWRILTSSILEWRTGAPFSAFTGVDSNGDGQLTDRPIIAGVPLLRNSFRQPNHFQHDLRIAKRFVLGEDKSLHLSAELFNLWNTNNFLFTANPNEQGPAGAIGSLWGLGQTPLPTFRSKYLPGGSLNSNGLYANSPFQLQFALKYQF
ncbi:MAG: TonB-dependent receptor [Acidobacteria bacterium]|nr:TonB-dependent receptor [Acidobacteriota bacterium]